MAGSRLRAAAVLSGVVALMGCGGAAKPDTCLPACPDSASCRDTCGGTTCPCPQGDVCDGSGACVPCVAGSCQRSPAACVDECGNPDDACTSYCADPDSCVDECGVAGSPACAGVACDPRDPGGCRDTCGQYASKCCCVPTACADAASCLDDCRNFDPGACGGQVCGAACADSCGEPDASCWVDCADPTNCLDDCGNYNATACAGLICDPNKSGVDTCGQLADGC